MRDHEISAPTVLERKPWNKSKPIGAKPPLRPKHVWSIRTKLQVEGRTRDLAMFNLAIDSKLRGCDVVALKVEDIARTDMRSIARRFAKGKQGSRFGSR
jgi:hypothetical protein